MEGESYAESPHFSAHPVVQHPSWPYFICFATAYSGVAAPSENAPGRNRGQRALVALWCITQHYFRHVPPFQKRVFFCRRRRKSSPNTFLLHPLTAFLGFSNQTQSRTVEVETQKKGKEGWQGLSCNHKIGPLKLDLSSPFTQTQI